MKSIKEILKSFIMTMPRKDALKLLGELIDNDEDNSKEWEELQDQIITMSKE